MEYLKIITLSLLIILTVLMCLQESKRKTLSFPLALLLCFIITPFGVYLLFRFLPNRNPIGCLHCGNKSNESEYCGLCGKNAEGNFYPGWIQK